MSAVSICYTACFILLQVIFFNVVKSESVGPHNHASNNASEYKSSRTKRSLSEDMPQQLNLRVRYATGEVIDLEWTQRKEYLANKYLPVIVPRHYSNRDVMNDVGEFVVYHDFERCSAVVYFGKLQAFFGVIGMNYYISYLPFEFDNSGNYPGVIGEPYVMRRVHTPVHEYPEIPDMFIWDLLHPPDHDSDVVIEHLSDPDPGPCTKRRRTKRDYEAKSSEDLSETNVSETIKIRNRRWHWTYDEHYLETLVFVIRDIVQIFKGFWGEDHYVEYIVRYYILYFNALDMIFQKLRHESKSMLINIAKIVIEDDSAPFDFISNDEFQFTDIVMKLPQYLNIRQHEYSPDSFDHVFISTSRPIKNNLAFVSGATKHDVDLYEARKDDQFYNAVPITVVGLESDYVVGVHEISRILKIDKDFWQDGLAETGQCNSIMQEGSSKCDTCLKWSEHSKLQFIEFFSKNRYSCFLLNSPRSVRPPGAIRSLSPIKQCQCYGYTSYIPNGKGQRKQIINKDDCNVPLMCQNVVEERTSYEYTVRPFDGTPCGTNKHVCWNGRCTKYDERC